MTSHPLTRLEAAHVIDDYRLGLWNGATLDRTGLQHVLTGAAWDDMPARIDGITEQHACRALDWHHDRYHRPPTPREAHDALDQVTSSPSAIRDHIDTARTALAAAKARRAQDHERLRREADQRRKRAS